jgi:hypothetical protein
VDCGSVNLAFGRDRISNAVLWHSGSGDARPQPIWDLAAGDLGLGAYYVVVSHGVKILHDPDTYPHITTGRWILAHHAVPHHGIFSLDHASSTVGRA